MTTGAIIVAAGSSQRMGGIDKLLTPLGGRPVIACSIAVTTIERSIPFSLLTCSITRLNSWPCMVHLVSAYRSAS